MKRKMYFCSLLMGLFFVASFSVVAYARSNTIYKDYGGITLECYINCTSSKGSGYTNGANMDGYRNYIKVVTYDIDQVMLDYGERYSITRAGVTVDEGSPYLTRTFHAAADTYNNQLLPIYSQIQQTQGR